MADSNIGALPLASTIADDSLLVMEQQGTAMKVTGQQLKEYAKQGVELEFQEDLAASQAAANRAQSAVQAVEDMTVEAKTLSSGQPATVSKTIKNGKVNLSFGLPMGEQGIPGPSGQTGPRGPRGEPGNGLTVLGHYDTEAALRASVTAPEAGDSYSVGVNLPYDIYIFDGVSGDWRNYGPLSGGGIPSKDAVISEGGASLVMQGAFDSAPHVVTFTDEEQPPLTAEDVAYDNGSSVKEEIDSLKSSVSDGKQVVASAITDKGVPTAQDATFAQLAENIAQITTDSDTSDATATPGDILGGKTAYTASGKVEGIIPSLPAQTIVPGTSSKTIANGQYLAGTQTIQGEPNLTSGNIKKGVSLFGVAGALETSFAAVLTVTADTGAVVTATCGDTSVEALSTTGTVVMELPVEGTWKVTAVRGMAQYNTVTLEVSNHYNAALTAALHVQRLMTATPLSVARDGLTASHAGGYALFGGGERAPTLSNNGYSIGDSGSFPIDAYDAELVHSDLSSVMEQSITRRDLAAASVGDYALFGGGQRYVTTSTGGSGGSIPVMQYSSVGDVLSVDSGLVISSATQLSDARHSLAAATVGNYALFCGGVNRQRLDNSFDFVGKGLATVDAYNKSLTRSTPTQLSSTYSSRLAGAANTNYAIFFNGGPMDAYSKGLTRTIVSTGLSRVLMHPSSATAGNYVLFAGGYNVAAGYVPTVDAFDLFLTRTTAEPLISPRESAAGATIRGFAVFGGGDTIDKYRNRVVDVYDPYLVRTNPDSLIPSRENLAAVSVGDYLLFGGGKISSSGRVTGTVDVYQYT